MGGGGVGGSGSKQGGGGVLRGGGEPKNLLSLCMCIHAYAYIMFSIVAVCVQLLYAEQLPE